MRSFRFPRSTMVLMVLILAGIIFAIDKAQDVQRLYSGSPSSADVPGLYGVFVVLALAFACIGALGYVVLYALRQSGTQRLMNVRTWGAR